MEPTSEPIEGDRWPVLIGRVLVGYRSESGLAQEDAAGRMGMTRDQLGRLERGATDWDKIVRACNVYGVRVSDVVDRAEALGDREELDPAA